MKPLVKLHLLLLCQGFLFSAVPGIPFTEDLYRNEVDIGIRSFERTEIKETLQNTTKLWLIQFYSSWCGHCQRFVPHFKKFGKRVEGWIDVIGFGAINCAQEYNLETCRHYDINGYPTLKLYAPYESIPKAGFEIEIQDSNGLVQAITDWIETFQHNKVPELLNYAPDLTSLTEENLLSIWKTDNKRLYKADTAIIVFSNDTQDSMTNNLIMDHYHLTKPFEKQTIIRKVSIGQGNMLKAGSQEPFSKPVKLARRIGIKKDSIVPLIVAVKRPKENLKTQSSRGCNAEVLKVKVDDEKMFDRILASIVSYSKNASYINTENLEPIDCKDSTAEKKEAIVPPKPIKRVNNVSMIDNRRYKVYMSDLENALLYSLAHEVSEKKTISGKSYEALKHYLQVLIRLFPTSDRAKTLLFLQELYSWTQSHEHGFAGEDFGKKINNLKKRFASFSDVDEYIGCKGSSPQYGNYPCALWSLWHVLTVRQLEQRTHNPTSVLKTMVEYIEHFFGCKICADHFLAVAEHGQAIQREVKSAEDSTLWLWHAHNKATLRLQGDEATDDPAYPKSVFPDEISCPKCFLSNTTTYSNIDFRSLNKSFDVNEVLRFLQNHYTKIDLKNLELKPDFTVVPKSSTEKVPERKHNVSRAYSNTSINEDKMILSYSTSQSQDLNSHYVRIVMLGIVILLMVFGLKNFICRKLGRCVVINPFKWNFDVKLRTKNKNTYRKFSV